MSESVYEKSTKEIMDRLLMAVMDGWMNDMLNSDLTTWDFAADTITEIDVWKNRDENSVVELLAYFARDASGDLAMSKEEFVQLWNRLTPEQKEAFLKELYHNMAMYGLIDFLDTEGGEFDPKDVADYFDNRAVFQYLIKSLANKYNLDLRGEYGAITRKAKSFNNAIELSKYLTDEELMELVKKYVLPQLEKQK
jgi:hypothetical protein